MGSSGPSGTVTGRPAPAALPPSLRARLGPIAAAAALLVLALGLLYAGHSGPGRADGWIRPLPHGVRTPRQTFALATDYLGEPAGAVMLVAATVILSLLLRRPRTAVLTVAAAGAAVATTTLLKPLVGRTINGGYLSFPSGHTAFLTAIALVLALLVTGRLGLGRTAGLSLVLAAALAAGAAMGWAQVALGAHYPTDTLGGWCTALAVVPATAWLVDGVADRMTDTGRREPHGRHLM
ncbi:phosphatase PAP2 family protein [Streptomyces tanashiensis]|uniref:phosphatase PAP2 family protein n=1 Tax=Streptomyces tanashiensis TaxID=67367 RepID=UPI0033E2350B